MVYTVKICTMTYISRPWYEWTDTVQSLHQSNSWVSCHFKTIFKVDLYWLEELSPRRLEPQTWVVCPSVNNEEPLQDHLPVKLLYEFKELGYQEYLNREHADCSQVSLMYGHSKTISRIKSTYPQISVSQHTWTMYMQSYFLHHQWTATSRSFSK